MRILHKIQTAKNQLKGFSSAKVRITFEIQRDPKSYVRYHYPKGVTDTFLQSLEIHHISNVCWRIGTYYDLVNKPNLDIDVEVDYNFAHIEYSAQKYSDTQFDVYYQYKTSVEMNSENAKHFLFDLSKAPSVQDLMFSFTLNGETMYPGDHPDLLLDFASFSKLLDITIEEI